MAKAGTADAPLRVEQVELRSIRPHPRNYRRHPEKQVEHLVASQEEFGLYRPIVIAEDGTILAGHGVAEAARKRKVATVPAVRVPFAADDPPALKLMALDNTVTRGAEDDLAALAGLLQQVADDLELVGTGYDLAGLNDLLAQLALDDVTEFTERDKGVRTENQGRPTTQAEWRVRAVTAVQVERVSALLAECEDVGAEVLRCD